MTSIVVLGGSFAGINAAFELELELGQAAEITVVARDSRFVFLPSLVWVPPGWRKPGQISMELAPVLYRRGIKFLHATAERIDPDQNTVFTDKGDLHYDYLLIATGARYDWSGVPGLGPNTGDTYSICNIASCHGLCRSLAPLRAGPRPGGHRVRARGKLLRRRLRDGVQHRPSPASGQDPRPGSARVRHRRALPRSLRPRRDARRRADAQSLLQAARHHALRQRGDDGGEQGLHHPHQGPELRHKYAIVIPPFTGAQAILDSPGLGDQKGFIPVNDHYQHTSYENIYAAGVAVQIKPQWRRPRFPPASQDGLDVRGDGQGRGTQRRRRHPGWGAA